MFLFSVAFLFAWTPYSVVGLHKVLGYSEKTHISRELTLLPLVTAKTAGMWNPLIFSFKNREVRAFLAASLYRLRERLQMEIFNWRRNRVLPHPDGLGLNSPNVINMHTNVTHDRPIASTSSGHKLEPREPTISAHLFVVSGQGLNRSINANQSEIETDLNVL